MSSTLNYTNFEIFGRLTSTRPEAGKHRSSFTRFTRNTYHVHMRLEDYKRAERAYLKTLHDPKAHTAVENLKLTNPYKLQEYLLYGETWVLKEYPAVDGQRQFLVGVRDHFDKALRLFQEPSET